MRLPTLTLCLVCGIASLVGGAASHAEDGGPSWSQPRPSKLNPVTLLREAIAALMPALGQDDVASFAPAQDELAVSFASGNERVSLSLADSQVRVRLGDELRLHCEVSSRDEIDADPELGIDLAVQFKFK